MKPQLEQLLNLPKDSLTKEIKLTQDLMRRVSLLPRLLERDVLRPGSS